MGTKVADIFISYSKPDRDKVVMLAAYLESEGWTTWWDNSLAVGEKYRDEIMKQLAAARAVIVLWTPTSVKSDFVRAEAGRAKADRKLIPVKDAGVGYHDIPLPFGEMHTEDLSKRELIRAAVIVQFAKAPPPAPIWKKLRFEFLTWVSITATAITFAGFMGGVFRLARWSQLLLENWILLIHRFWKTVLFFVPHVAKLDAVVFTFSGLLATSMLRSRRDDGEQLEMWHIAFASIAVICLSLCFSVGLLDAFSKARSEKSFVMEYNGFITDTLGHVGIKDYTVFELNVVGRESVQLTASNVIADFLMFLTLLAMAAAPALLLHNGGISVIAFSNRISSVMLLCAGILLFSMLASWLMSRPLLESCSSSPLCSPDAA